jgi:ATP-dependent Lon protease
MSKPKKSVQDAAHAAQEILKAKKTRKVWNSHARAQMQRTMQDFYQTERGQEMRRHLSEVNKRIWDDPERKPEFAARMKEKLASPEVKAKIAKHWADYHAWKKENTATP